MHTQTRTHMYTHTHTHTDTYTHVHTCTHTYTQTRTHMYTHVQTNSLHAILQKLLDCFGTPVIYSFKIVNTGANFVKLIIAFIAL